MNHSLKRLGISTTLVAVLVWAPLSVAKPGPKAKQQIEKKTARAKKARRSVLA